MCVCLHAQCVCMCAHLCMHLCLHVYVNEHVYLHMFVMMCSLCGACMYLLSLRVSVLEGFEQIAKQRFPGFPKGSPRLPMPPCRKPHSTNADCRARSYAHSAKFDCMRLYSTRRRFISTAATTQQETALDKSQREDFVLLQRLNLKPEMLNFGLCTG